MGVLELPAAPLPVSPAAAVPVHGPASKVCRGLRVLVFVEARGITGAIRNLLDAAREARAVGGAVEWELATYLRSGERQADGGVLDCVDAARAAGLRAHVLPERGAGDPALVARVRNLVHQVDPDIVETQHVKSHLLAVLAGAHRRRWVALHHGYTTTTLKVRAANVLDRWTLGRPSLVVTPCEALARQLGRRGVAREKVAVVHNAVHPVAEDPAVTLRLRAGLGVPAGGALIACLGRLSREKAQEVLIAALAQPHLGGRATLVLVGDGPDRARLERLASRLGIAGRVRFAGYQRDPWPWIHAADAIALPSDSEGSPNALLEAMAAGKAVVATRVGGVPEMLDHGSSGLLVPARSPIALARALSDVLCAPALARSLGRCAREVALSRFSVPRRTARLSQLYAEVCA